MKIIKIGRKKNTNFVVIQSNKKIIIAQKQGTENYQIISEKGEKRTITPGILDKFIAAIIRQEKEQK